MKYVFTNSNGKICHIRFNTNNLVNVISGNTTMSINIKRINEPKNKYSAWTYMQQVLELQSDEIEYIEKLCKFKAFL